MIRSIVFVVSLLVLMAKSQTQTEDMYDDSSIIKQEEDIPQKACEKNEVWMECSSCEQQCGKEVKPCPRICQPAKCQCPAHKGYRRDESGNCIFCHTPVNNNNNNNNNNNKRVFV